MNLDAAGNACVRPYDDVVEEMLQLRESGRKLSDEVLALRRQIEDWRCDAVRRDEENKRLRAALAAAHDLLGVYL